jgi:aconitate hydratase
LAGAGGGPPAAIHRRGFAAPGRTLATSVAGGGGAGAFAMLALAPTATEAAALLAGEPFRLERPDVLGVRVRGSLPADVGGAEVLRALSGSFEGSARGVIVEFHGDGLAALAMSERIAMAALGPSLLGARAIVFPSDDLTREYLAARGRDADWRRSAGTDRGFERAFEFDLGSVPPAPGEPTRVRFGALAEDDDLRALANAAAAGTPLGMIDVVVGGRTTRAALAEDGVLEALELAGARLLDTGEALARASVEPGVHACGDSSDAPAPAISTRATLAWLGAAPPAPVAPPRRRSGAALASTEVLPPAAPGAAAPIERAAAHRVPAIRDAFEDSPRGEVLLHVNGDVPGAEVLAWGPRAQSRRGDDAELAALVLRARDAGLAARAAGRTPLFLTASGEWGEGAVHDAAARGVAALGVRAVIASAFPPAHARALAAQGVLPLAWGREPDMAHVDGGDELELPAIGEALARSSRVWVRNLTRAVSFEAKLALDEEWRTIARAGGLLASVGREPVESEA